jgi:hypothetical protein
VATIPTTVLAYTINLKTFIVQAFGLHNKHLLISGKFLSILANTPWCKNGSIVKWKYLQQRRLQIQLYFVAITAEILL